MHRIRSQCNTHPLLTPSICRSTHHTPGMPMRSHSAQYLKVFPIGIHSRKQKYRIETLIKRGTRTAKKKTDTGVHRIFEGAGGTGKNGAMAVPGGCGQPQSVL